MDIAEQLKKQVNFWETLCDLMQHDPNTKICFPEDLQAIALMHSDHCISFENWDKPMPPLEAWNTLSDAIAWQWEQATTIFGFDRTDYHKTTYPNDNNKFNAKLEHEFQVYHEFMWLFYHQQSTLIN